MRAWLASGLQDQREETATTYEVADFPAPADQRSASILRMSHKWVTGYPHNQVKTIQFDAVLNRKNTRRLTTHVVGFQLRESEAGLTFHEFYSMEQPRLFDQVAGPIHWFILALGVEIEPLFDPKNQWLLDRVLATEPLPGRLFVPHEEVEANLLLGTPPPPAWDADQLYERFQDDPGTEWIGFKW